MGDDSDRLSRADRHLLLKSDAGSQSAGLNFTDEQYSSRIEFESTLKLDTMYSMGRSWERR